MEHPGGLGQGQIGARHCPKGPLWPSTPTYWLGDFNPTIQNLTKPYKSFQMNRRPSGVFQTPFYSARFVCVLNPWSRDWNPKNTFCKWQ